MEISKSPLEDSLNYPGIYLPRRTEWFHRVAMQIPVKPETANLSVVRDTLLDVVEAAGGLEFARGELSRVIALAQGEYDSLVPPSQTSGSWSGVTGPAVYTAFFECAIWTRAVTDRFKGPLMNAVHPFDPKTWNVLEKIRSRAGYAAFKDAQRLAGVSLHRYPPPYAGSGARVIDRKLIFPVLHKVEHADFRENLRFDTGRHAKMVVEEYWNAVCLFVNGLIDELCPRG